MAIAGFWKTYFGKIPSFNGVSGLMHFHAIMVLSWLGILIAQPILILNKKIELHRAVGKASYFVVSLLLLSIILLMRLSFIKNTLPLNPAIDLRLALWVFNYLREDYSLRLDFSSWVYGQEDDKYLSKT